MSRCGREEPYRHPRIDLSKYIDETRNDASAVAAGTPSRIAWPCRSRRSIACRISSVRPTHSKAWSAPVGRISRTPSAEARKCVAPNCRATASFAGLASTATIVSAPAIRAPWITLSPMPPVPITTTVSPRSTFARLSTAPTPVSTPQPIRAADVSGMSAGIFTACTALTRVRSANAELEANWYSGLPPRENGCPGIPIALRHIVGLPRSHWAHAPQLASVDSET